MLEIIPAIDLINGECVRLTHGDYSQQTSYNSDPLAQAKLFEEAGIKRLHIVDLDGAKQKRPMHLNVLQKIAQHTNLVIDYGGGLKTTEHIATVLEHGAAMANVGSVAALQPELFWQWIEHFGNEKLLLAADVKDENVVVNAWQDSLDVSIFDYITQHQSRGLTQFFCTDISKDGALEGTALPLYEKLRKRFADLKIIASGGVSNTEDLKALEKLGIDGAIVGKAIYEGRIQLSELF